MQITVYDQPRELLVQTVRVHHNHDNPDGLVIFHCPYCCDKVVQIQGLVAQLSPGLEPTEDVVMVNKAYGCDLRYVFQSTSQHDEPTKVILNSFEEDHKVKSVFHCYVCRTPLISFAKEIWILKGGVRPVELPIYLECPKPYCPAKYWVVDVI